MADVDGVLTKSPSWRGVSWASSFLYDVVYAAEMRPRPEMNSEHSVSAGLDTQGDTKQMPTAMS